MRYEQLDEQEMRAQICRVGQRLYDLFMVAGNDGNISVRLSEDEILLTPSGISKGGMTPDDLIKITPQGDPIGSSNGRYPSSEFRMHLIIYQERPEVRAVVHAHPSTATGFAVAGVPLDRAFLPEVVVRTGPTPLVPYTIPGGEELPSSIRPYIKGHNTLLLGNHGVVTYADTLTNAFFNMETVELDARIYLVAHQLGRINFLTEQQVAELQSRYS